MSKNQKKIKFIHSLLACIIKGLRLLVGLIIYTPTTTTTTTTTLGFVVAHHPFHPLSTLLSEREGVGPFFLLLNLYCNLQLLVYGFCKKHLLGLSITCLIVVVVVSMLLFR